MALNRDDLKSVRQRKYLAKDFDSLRAQLLEYARLYYPDRIRDFSESSLGGLFLDFAAYTGDVLSFYLDHQYAELNYDTAVEAPNIERALRNSGVPIVGASPAIVPVTIYVSVPAEKTQNVLGPSVACLPKVMAGSIFSADNGVEFILLEDVDFNRKKSDGSFAAQIKVGNKTSSGTPTTFIMAQSGMCVSGKEVTENISIGKDFIPFRRITLSNANVSEITSVIDGFGNVYYQVASLSHDVVYRNVLNTAKDNELVKDAINVNPQQLLQTKTLGTAASDTTLQINYRYSGGLNHNVPANNVRTVKTLKVFFPGNPSAALAANVKGSIEITNKIAASGGEDAPTSDDLKAQIPAIKNSQERIVTREDLLARVYTLPSNFGRVFRASIRSNPNNPLATQLFIVSRDPQSKLITSPDTLKRNLRSYLNPYRMISDAIDILDARVINLTMSFDVLIDPALNRSVVLQGALTKLQTFFDIKNFHIDQPIVISDVVNNIFTVPGVVAVNNVTFQNIVGTNSNREYSSSTFDVQANTRLGIMFPTPGAIFEIRFPEFDIMGKAAV